jgi:myosin-3
MGMLGAALTEVMTQALILDRLEQRYAANVIYTYIGDVLLALNPFATLECYGACWAACRRPTCHCL